MTDSLVGHMSNENRPPEQARAYYEARLPKLEHWMKRRTITKPVIEEGVTQIGDYAFHDMPALTEVSLPGTLKRIGTQALSSEESLRTPELPESVESIGDGAFQGSAADMTLTVLNSACVFG